MTKAVIDTNVLVSGLLNEHGAEAAVLFTVAENKLMWCVSSAILAEYEAVLRRPKFSDIPERHITALLELAAAAHVFAPLQSLKVSPHEPDNRFIECAEAAQADFLITGNKRHFPSRWKSAKIVTARELFEQASLSAP
jgi:uncharacterized protein